VKKQRLVFFRMACRGINKNVLTGMMMFVDELPAASKKPL